MEALLAASAMMRKPSLWGNLFVGLFDHNHSHAFVFQPSAPRNIRTTLAKPRFTSIYLSMRFERSHDGFLLWVSLVAQSLSPRLSPTLAVQHVLCQTQRLLSLRCVVRTTITISIMSLHSVIDFHSDAVYPAGYHSLFPRILPWKLFTTLYEHYHSTTGNCIIASYYSSYLYWTNISSSFVPLKHILSCLFSNREKGITWTHHYYIRFVLTQRIQSLPRV